MSGLIRSHHLLDQSYDDHDDRPADTASGNLPDERTDVETAAGRGGLEGRHDHGEQLPAESATDSASDGIADGAETEILEEPARNVSSDGAADEFNDQRQ
jgi:hypothetical protein